MKQDEKYLLKMQQQINNLIVFHDLKYLPELVAELHRYCTYNRVKLNLWSRDLRKLHKLSK